MTGAAVDQPYPTRRPEPTREQVLDWMRNHPGAGQLACIRELWGPLSPADQARVYSRVSSWIYRDKNPRVRSKPDGRTLRQPAPLQPVTDDVVPASSSVSERVASERVPFLEAELGSLLTDVADARKRKEFKVIPQLTARIAATRRDLDDARAQLALTGAKLDRSPKAVADELRKHAQLLEMLAEAGGE